MSEYVNKKIYIKEMDIFESENDENVLLYNILGLENFISYIRNKEVI